jgi:hypothetical protein
MVEPQPSKLMMRVRSPSPAPGRPPAPWPRQPVLKPKRRAHVAQAVEHSLGKGEVTGSIPVMGTN